MPSFLVYSLIAGFGVAAVAAPLGCFVVWRRLAYMGEAVAQAGLLGVALGLLLEMDQTAPSFLLVAMTGLGLAALARHTVVPIDSLLGLVAHGLLALGVIATLSIRGGSVDLVGYLFGDIFAVTTNDLAWVLGGGAVVLAALVWLWQPLLRLSIHPELAEAEGVPRARLDTVFMLLLAVAIAVAIKVVGVLLAVAFLIMPAVAARPFARTPEAMAVIATLVAWFGVAAGIALSFAQDVPGGPAIVLVLAMAAIGAVLARPQGRRA
jgi:zinc transport system permease protein